MVITHRVSRGSIGFYTQGSSISSSGRGSYACALHIISHLLCLPWNNTGAKYHRMNYYAILDKTIALDLMLPPPNLILNEVVVKKPLHIQFQTTLVYTPIMHIAVFLLR